MIQIDSNRCIGCGQCVSDCFARQLHIDQGKVYFSNTGCIECGHCIAICPKGAVSMESVQQEEIIPLPHGIPKLDPEQYLMFLRGRRTIRQFNSKPVSLEQLLMLLEAGRLSPTGGNKQDVSMCVIQNSISNFRILVLETLKNHSDIVLNSSDALPKDRVYAAVWKKLHRDFFGQKALDRLFFGAPLVIVLSSIYPQNAAIAAAHMESIVYSMGLGMLYSGFTVIAASHSAQIQQFLELPAHYIPVACLVIGHPAVTYYRTVPRHKANIIWK